MEYVELNNGVKMPMLGYGVYQTPPKRQSAVCWRQWMWDTGALTPRRRMETRKAWGARWKRADCQEKNFSLLQKYGSAMPVMRGQGVDRRIPSKAAHILSDLL